MQNRAFASLLVALLHLRATDAKARDMEAPLRVSSKRSLSAANHKRNSHSPWAIDRGDPNRQVSLR